ncbi:NAD(P)/FAD-dependent oxidoreductase [Oceanobacillus salinisoli]|uniref:NAD(P)/FAD-dependent oxidoreductase n=1 Tax=Oceanobacillus salinisoli TaxID=2678611 RepID=UPI0012E0E1A7|nr:NAD(P)/FAD-dependent oxidoreductase [Oceanobacillus salinisoli]
MHRPHIVILGAGYGGMMTALKLQKQLHVNEADITLVNKEDYHYQAAWLHENAAGSLHHERTRVPIREIINENKINFVLDKVVSIKPEEKKVKLMEETLSYDILVIALGFESEMLGEPALEKNAFSIGDINSARLIREHLEYNFACYHNETEKNDARLNIVIGGGGATGSEFAGELADRIPQLCKEYDIEKALVRVIMLEAESSILRGFDEKLRHYAMNSLESRGVEIITGATLKECKPNSIVYEKDGSLEEIPTTTKIWAAGVRANSLVEKSGLGTKNGKVEVTKYLNALDCRDVYVVGDCAYVIDQESGEACNSTAQIAVQQASVVAHNVKAILKEKKLKPFEPKIKGMIVSLGGYDGIGVIFNNRKLVGWKAPLVKILIDSCYLLKLGGLNLVMKKGKFKFLNY